MKNKKLLDIVLFTLAIIGVLIFVGAVGNVDYCVEMHEYCSLTNTIIKMVVGVLLILPAYIRSKL